MSDKEKIATERARAEAERHDGGAQSFYASVILDLCDIADRQATYIEATNAVVRSLHFYGLAAKFEEIAARHGVDLTTERNQHDTEA